ITGNGQRQDWRRIGVKLLNERDRCIAWKPDARDLVTNILDSLVHPFFEIESDVEEGAALIRIRAQLVDSADRVDGFFQRLRQRAFCLLGTCARKVHAHAHSGGFGLRHQVDAECSIRKQPQRDERQGHHDRKNGTPNADFSELHSPPPLCPPRPLPPRPPAAPPFEGVPLSSGALPASSPLLPAILTPVTSWFRLLAAMISSPFSPLSTS